MAIGRFKEYSPRELAIENTRTHISRSSSDEYFEVIFNFTGRHRYHQWVIERNSTQLDSWCNASIELSPKTITFNPPSITSTQKDNMYRALNRGLVGLRLSISDRRNLAIQAVEEAWNSLVTAGSMSNKLELHIYIDFTLVHRKVANKNPNHRVDILDLERHPEYSRPYVTHTEMIRPRRRPSYTTMVPANEASIQSLKPFDHAISRGISCSICLEDFVDKGVFLPCSHMFHGDCIRRWLNTSHYCPLCRFRMPTHT